MEAVELTTGGLLLRPWTPLDADAVFEACQDPSIQRWAGVPSPFLSGHAADLVGAASARVWKSGAAAPLGVFDAATERLLGSHGLTSLDRATGIGEIGLWLAPWARGRGIGERATRAVALWALDVLELGLLVWRVELGNHPCRLVAERVGFSFSEPSAGVLSRRGGRRIADGWRGTLRPGEVRSAAPAWLAPGGGGARRARAFTAPQPTLIPSDLLPDEAREGGAELGEVRLRPLDEVDIDSMTDACRDAETARWTTVPAPYSPADARAFVRDRAPRLWKSGEGAVFGIVDPAGRFLGTVDLTIDRDDPECAAIGFLVAPAARGKGYATTAVRALCAWAFRTLALRRIVWRAYVGNVASRRVAEKSGFVFEGTQRSALKQRGERRDAWIAALLAHESGERATPRERPPRG